MNYKTNVVANKIKNFGIKISDLPTIMNYSRSQLYLYFDAYEEENFTSIPKEIKNAFDYLVMNNPTLGEFICYCEKNISDQKDRIDSNFLKTKSAQVQEMAFKAKALDILMKYFDISCRIEDISATPYTMNLYVKTNDEYAPGSDIAVALVALNNEKTKDDYRFLFKFLAQLKNDNSEVIFRDELCSEIERIFGSIDKFFDIVEEDIPYEWHYFKYDFDEIYIIDRKNCKFMNWYKLTHIGRDLHTDMKTKEEVIDFLQRLYDDWKKEQE